MNENAISTTYNKKEIDVTTIERKKSSFPVTKKAWEWQNSMWQHAGWRIRDIYGKYMINKFSSRLNKMIYDNRYIEWGITNYSKNWSLSINAKYLIKAIYLK